MAEYAHILAEVDGAVGLITLNEPSLLNRIDHGPGSIEEEFLDLMEQWDRDPGVRCIVVTGAGRAFSSGGDVSGTPVDDPPAWHRFLEDNVHSNRRIRELNTPTIGAINGLCLGAGFVLATHFDMLVASDEARFGLIETRFGSSGAHTLTYVVGPQWAKFLALSGEIITADTAREIGLVLRTFPATEFLERTLDLARRVAAMPHEAVVFNRRVVNAAVSLMGWEAQMGYSAALNTITNSVSRGARNGEGKVLSEVFREEGWTAFKKARDQAFEPPWLEPPAD